MACGSVGAGMINNADISILYWEPASGRVDRRARQAQFVAAAEMNWFSS